jgi:hypothetical protein
VSEGGSRPASRPVLRKTGNEEKQELRQKTWELNQDIVFS